MGLVWVDYSVSSVMDNSEAQWFAIWQDIQRQCRDITLARAC